MDVTLTLTPELEEFVRSEMMRGRFATADQAVLEGLRVLQEREETVAAHASDLRRLLAERREGAARGETIPVTDELFEDIKRRGRERLAQRPHNAG